MARRGRIGIYDRYNEAVAARRAAMTPEQRTQARRAEKLKALQPVGCAPVKGDPERIDWEYHECGYVPQTGPNGKRLPKSGPNAEPAWRWTEDPNDSRSPCLRTSVEALILRVYRLGHRHNKVELLNEGGFPDKTIWGPGGLILRELKPMRPQWKRGQKQHLLSLQEADLDVAVWFPCCLLSGLIDEELAELAGVPPKGAYARTRRGVPNRPITWEDVANGALAVAD